MLWYLGVRLIKKLTRMFVSTFQQPFHFYPTRFSGLNYVQPILNIQTSKYSILIRGRGIGF